MICFLSTTPNQYGKFHLLLNSVAISKYSFFEVGPLMNTFLLRTYNIA